MLMLSIEILEAISNVGGKNNNLNIIRFQELQSIKNSQKMVDNDFIWFIFIQNLKVKLQNSLLTKYPFNSHSKFLKKKHQNAFVLYLNSTNEYRFSLSFVLFKKSNPLKYFFKNEINQFLHFNNTYAMKTSFEATLKLIYNFLLKNCKELQIFFQSIKRVMKLCKLCGYQFSPVSSRYFCCDKSQPVCIVCRRDLCKKCKNPRINQLLTPQCEKCHSRLFETDLLNEYNCDKYYCSRCLSNVFKNAYNNVVLKKKYDQKNQQIFVKMYCGHQYPYNDLLAYFQHFCIECGRSYDVTVDYELNDGAKLCYFCFKYVQQIYNHVFIRCISCENILQNSSKAELIDNEGIILCHLCASQSRIQQKSIQESRKILQNTENTNKKIQEKQIEKDSSVKIFKQKEEEIQEKKTTKSPLNKFLKKPSISQLKQKQSQRVNNGKNDKSSHSFSVTSKFSNQLQQIDDDLAKQLGLSQKIKMKKHLSNQTFVQQFKIQIQQNKANQFLQCKKCSSFVLRNLCYDINQKHKYEKTSLSFSTLDSSSQDKDIIPNYMCHVCYFNSTQRNIILSQSKQSISSQYKVSEAKRPSKIQQTKSSMNYLKVQNSPKRGVNNPSPSPNKQYSLTGSKHSNHSKSSLINIAPSKIKIQQKPSQTKKNIDSKTSQFQNVKKTSQKCCSICGMKKRTLILTLRQGQICDDCYYRKSPQSYSKN